MTTGNQRALKKDADREQAKQKAALLVPLALAAKLVAIVVHTQELFGPQGHHFDREALKPLLADEDVNAWIKALGVLAPRRRLS